MIEARRRVRETPGCVAGLARQWGVSADGLRQAVQGVNRSYLDAVEPPVKQRTMSPRHEYTDYECCDLLFFLRGMTAAGATVAEAARNVGLSDPTARRSLPLGECPEGPRTVCGDTVRGGAGRGAPCRRFCRGRFVSLVNKCSPLRLDGDVVDGEWINVAFGLVGTLMGGGITWWTQDRARRRDFEFDRAIKQFEACLDLYDYIASTPLNESRFEIENILPNDQRSVSSGIAEFIDISASIERRVKRCIWLSADSLVAQGIAEMGLHIGVTVEMWRRHIQWLKDGDIDRLEIVEYPGGLDSPATVKNRYLAYAKDICSAARAEKDRVIFETGLIDRGMLAVSKRWRKLKFRAGLLLDKRPYRRKRPEDADWEGVE